MKTQALLIVICSFLVSFGATHVQAQNHDILNQIYSTSPALQASQDLAGQVDGWFREMEEAAEEQSYLDQIYSTSPSLKASRELGQQVDGWFEEMERDAEEYRRKYPNGNPEAEARGRDFIMGMMGAYQIQEDASHERRKTQLNRRYKDTYNKARSARDYYWSRGNHKKAREMQRVMDQYNPRNFK